MARDLISRFAEPGARDKAADHSVSSTLDHGAPL
jgi:hypothetical protein